MADFAPDLLSSFIHEVASQTGIVIRDRDRATFAKKLADRVRASRQPDLQQYYDWLFAKPYELRDRQTARGAEWQCIVQQISITESYFFRDRGQFQLLREQILPQVIAERRQVADVTGQKPRLRIWSAASSTGEEPYSLAILVWELIADLADWDICIIGTDINEAAIATARKAAYSDWSFRQVDPAIRDRYFKHRISSIDKPWQLDPNIANLVTFHPLNLAQPDYPNSDLDLIDLDVILCRNVFIYLDGQTIRDILDRMAKTLNQTGYLLTAHAELQHQDTRAFKAQLCPQSVIYQRCDSLTPTLAGATSSPMPLATAKSFEARSPIDPPRSVTSTPQRPASRPTPSSLQARSTPIQRPHPTAPDQPTPSNPNINRPRQPEITSIEQQMAAAIALFHRRDYPKTITILDQLLTQQPRHFAACDLLSLAYANLGQYNQASYYCSKALEIDPCATSPYYLMAHLAENSGNIARAKTLLKRIVYLDPEAALAYLELAALYSAEGDTTRAQTMQRTARILLAARDANETLDPYRQLSVGSVLQQLGQPSGISRSPMAVDGISVERLKRSNQNG
jgi:chemotaxis protein methyltransferase CheR